MKRSILAALAASAMAGAAAGDVLVLKGGRKVIGRVSEKADAYEAVVEGQTLVFPKDEVARWIRSPKEIVGDSNRLVEEAKALYQQALAAADPAEAEKLFREALPKVVKAREAYAEARDLFPEGYSELDSQLLNIMRLMRLIRERIGSSLASAPAPAPVRAIPATPRPPESPPPPPPPPGPAKTPPPAKAGLPEAFSILVDPSRRAAEGPRRAAAEIFREAGEARGPLADLATASHLFLSRDDKDWQLVQDSIFVKGAGFENTYRGRLVKKSDDLFLLEMTDHRALRLRRTPAGPQILPPGGSEFQVEDCRVETDQKTDAYQALQDFLQGLGPERLAGLPEKETAEVLGNLARRIKEIRGRHAEAPVKSLLLFFSAAASALVERSGGRAGPALEPALREAGFQKSEFAEVWGQKADLALDDYQKWMASGEYGLALVQFGRDYATLADFPVRYAHGLLMLRKAIADNRYYGRAAYHFEQLARAVSSTGVRDHLEAMARSIRDASPCMVCGGTHQVNCTACKGRKKLTLECGTCGGSGKVQTLRGVADCRACKGKGRWVNVDCPKCKATGKAECKARYCVKPVPPPTMESFAEAVPCPACRGRGMLLRHVAFPCRECLGIGQILRPRADPQKTIR